MIDFPAYYLFFNPILKVLHDLGGTATVQDVYKAVVMHSSGQMSDGELFDLERVACASGVSGGGQFTANTMACVSEAIGLALPNSTAVPAPRPR